ncbi:MAG: hypothetical protein ACP5G0_03550 [Desulfomonilia bacterium]
MPGPQSGKEVQAAEPQAVQAAAEADDGSPGGAAQQGADAQEAQQQQEEQQEEQKTWAEFQLLDAVGAPVKKEKCKITLPDGKEMTLKTNGEGVVRMDDIPPGSVTIQLSDRYDYEWVFEHVEQQG